MNHMQLIKGTMNTDVYSMAFSKTFCSFRQLKKSPITALSMTLTLTLLAEHELVICSNSSLSEYFNVQLGMLISNSYPSILLTATTL